MGALMDNILKEMKVRAEKLKDDRCHAFPNLICDEVTGLGFDSWCEPCQARTVMKALSEIERRENEKA